MTVHVTRQRSYICRCSNPAILSSALRSQSFSRPQLNVGGYSRASNWRRMLGRNVLVPLLAVVVAVAPAGGQTTASPPVGRWTVVTEGERTRVSIDTFTLRNVSAPEGELVELWMRIEFHRSPVSESPPVRERVMFQRLDCRGRRASSLEGVTYYRDGSSEHDILSGTWHRVPPGSNQEFVLAAVCSEARTGGGPPTDVEAGWVVFQSDGLRSVEIGVNTVAIIDRSNGLRQAWIRTVLAVPERIGADLVTKIVMRRHYDCVGRRSRLISLYSYNAGGGGGYSQDVDPWKEEANNTPGAALLARVCEIPLPSLRDGIR